MADTYEAFYNGKPLNPNRGLPTMTYAQAEDCGLTESERLWCRTDGEDTPVTADDIPYSTEVSVKDALDGTSETPITTNGLTCTFSKVGHLVHCEIIGIPIDTTITTSFTVPKAKVGAYLTQTQWSDISRTNVQVWIDDNSTGLNIRYYSANYVRTSIDYVSA